MQVYKSVCVNWSNYSGPNICGEPGVNLGVLLRRLLHYPLGQPDTRSFVLFIVKTCLFMRLSWQRIKISIKSFRIRYLLTLHFWIRSFEGITFKIYQLSKLEMQTFWHQNRVSITFHSLVIVGKGIQSHRQKHGWKYFFTFLNTSSFIINQWPVYLKPSLHPFIIFKHNKQKNKQTNWLNSSAPRT